MRGIIWRFTRMESEDVRKSTWPRDILQAREFKKGMESFTDCIGIWVTIEKGDKDEYLDNLVSRIVEVNEQFHKLKKVVVTPFAHLSNKLEAPERAKAMLEKLRELLAAHGFEVHRISFGTHKRVLWEVPGDVAGASYFEFPYSGKKPEVENDFEDNSANLAI